DREVVGVRRRVEDRVDVRAAAGAVGAVQDEGAMGARVAPPRTWPDPAADSEADPVAVGGGAAADGRLGAGARPGPWAASPRGCRRGGRRTCRREGRRGQRRVRHAVQIGLRGVRDRGGHGRPDEDQRGSRDEQSAAHHQDSFGWSVASVPAAKRTDGWAARVAPRARPSWNRLSTHSRYMTLRMMVVTDRELKRSIWVAL